MDRKRPSVRGPVMVSVNAAILPPAFDDVTGLDKEVGVSGILDQEFVHIPGLVKEPCLLFHGLFEDGV